MNNILKLSVAGLALAASAQAQIEINENLSVTGFLDMSAVRSSADEGVEGTFRGDDGTSYNLDQAEIDFLFSFDEISGQVDLNYTGDNSTGDFSLEQAFITYDFGDGASVTAGKFLSYHGWETFEPTGLYQYSFAYEMNGSIPGHHNGVSFDYNDDTMSLGLAVLDGVWDVDGSLASSEYGLEAKAAFFPAEGLTVYFGYALDSYKGRSDDELINFWTSYEVGNATYAIEYNDFEIGGYDGNSWLAMANFAINETTGITFRISEDESEISPTAEEGHTKYTISPNWTINDNLALIFEVSQVDWGEEGDRLEVAFETLFTF